MVPGLCRRSGSSHCLVFRLAVFQNPDSENDPYAEDGTGMDEKAVTDGQ